MIKISLGEHTLFIANDVCSFHLDTIQKKRAITYRFSTVSKFLEILHNIQSYDIKNHILYHNNVEEILEILKIEFEFIEAAGGLVLDENGKFLFIFRNGKWDLPKGKMELYETKELTAIREVEEECGIKIDSLEKHILTTYHTYLIGKKQILKANYWFLMKTHSQQKLVPQTDEGIELADWKTEEDIPQLLKNSYDSIRDILLAYKSFT